MSVYMQTHAAHYAVDDGWKCISRFSHFSRDDGVARRFIIYLSKSQSLKTYFGYHFYHQLYISHNMSDSIMILYGKSRRQTSQ